MHLTPNASFSSCVGPRTSKWHQMKAGFGSSHLITLSTSSNTARERAVWTAMACEFIIKIKQYLLNWLREFQKLNWLREFQKITQRCFRDLQHRFVKDVQKVAPEVHWLCVWPTEIIVPALIIGIKGYMIIKNNEGTIPPDRQKQRPLRAYAVSIRLRVSQETRQFSAEFVLQWRKSWIKYVLDRKNGKCGRGKTGFYFRRVGCLIISLSQGYVTLTSLLTDGNASYQKRVKAWKASFDVGRRTEEATRCGIFLLKASNVGPFK